MLLRTATCNAARMLSLHLSADDRVKRDFAILQRNDKKKYLHNLRPGGSKFKLCVKVGIRRLRRLPVIGEQVAAAFLLTLFWRAVGRPGTRAGFGLGRIYLVSTE